MVHPPAFIGEAAPEAPSAGDSAAPARWPRVEELLERGSPGTQRGESTGLSVYHEPSPRDLVKDSFEAFAALGIEPGEMGDPAPRMGYAVGGAPPLHLSSPILFRVNRLGLFLADHPQIQCCQ